jgi:hypothetical protein
MYQKLQYSVKGILAVIHVHKRKFRTFTSVYQHGEESGDAGIIFGS